jgi:hypothetical protein
VDELSAEDADFDWDDPAHRARALKILGPVCYNAALVEHCRRSKRDNERPFTFALNSDPDSRSMARND